MLYVLMSTRKTLASVARSQERTGQLHEFSLEQDHFANDRT